MAKQSDIMSPTPSSESNRIQTSSNVTSSPIDNVEGTTFETENNPSSFGSGTSFDTLAMKNALSSPLRNAKIDAAIRVTPNKSTTITNNEPINDSIPFPKLKNTPTEYLMSDDLPASSSSYEFDEDDVFIRVNASSPTFEQHIEQRTQKRKMVPLKRSTKSFLSPKIQGEPDNARTFNTSLYYSSAYYTNEYDDTHNDHYIDQRPILRHQMKCDNCGTDGHRWMHCLEVCRLCASEEHKAPSCEFRQPAERGDSGENLEEGRLTPIDMDY